MIGAAVANHPPATSTQMEVWTWQGRKDLPNTHSYTAIGLESERINLEGLLRSLLGLGDPDIALAMSKAPLAAKRALISIQSIFILGIQKHPDRLVGTDGGGFMLAYQFKTGRITYEIDSDGDMAYLWEDANSSEIKDIEPESLFFHILQILKKIGSL